MTQATDQPLPQRQGVAWTEDEDRLLYEDFLAGRSAIELANQHQRSVGGVNARLKRLGLVDLNGEIVEPTPPFVAPARRRSESQSPLGSNSGASNVDVVFALSASDGWRVEIHSNQPLNKPAVDRLISLLHNITPDLGA